MVPRGERSSNAPDLLDNLQAWSDNGYDTNLLHSNLAFPLLKQLIKVGDKKANKAFKEEIAFRLESGYLPTIKYLWNEGFIKYLLREETSIIPDLKYKELEHILAIEDFVNVKFYWAETGEDLTEKRVYFSTSGGYITELAIFYISDMDVFPKPITELKHLTKLTIYGTSIKSIIDNISNLKSLKYLDLSSNKINKLPETIGECKSLKVLNLSGNIVAQLPQSIGNLTMLTQLDLSNNNLSQLPDSIGKLTNLKDLNIRSNQFKTLPPSMENLYSLESLDLQKNIFTSIPELIFNLKSLNSLLINRNKIDTNNTYKNLLKLNGLTYLQIDKNNLGQFNELIEKLEKIKRFSLQIDNGYPPSVRYLWNEGLIKRFILEEPSITPKFNYKELKYVLDIEDLVNTKVFWAGDREDPIGKKVWFSVNDEHITELVIADIPALDIFPEPITNLRHLIKLTMLGNSITSIPDTIGNLASLKFLDLSQNKIIRLPETIGNCNKLEVLKLRGNVIKQLPQSIGNLTLLTQLDLFDNSLSILPDSIGKLGNLKNLNLGRNKLETLPTSIENLKSL